MATHKVLSTKKLEARLVSLAKEQGIDVLEQEAIQTRPILTKEKWEEIFSLLEQKIPYAVFTSSNSVEALKKYLHSYVNYLPPQWKIFCLSGKTKEALLKEEEAFGSVIAAASGAGELAKRVIAEGVQELLFFCGDKRRDELPAMLQAGGVTVHEVVVYETMETPVNAPDDYEAVLFFSPSAVQSFFSVNQLKQNTVCFAIGHTTANSVTRFTQNKLCISKEPTQEALLKEIINYFKTR